MDSEAWVAFCRASRKYDQMVNRHGAGHWAWSAKPFDHLEGSG